MLVGYMRVSKADGSQTLDLQRDALLAAETDTSGRTTTDTSGSTPTLKADHPVSPGHCAAETPYPHAISLQPHRRPSAPRSRRVTDTPGSRVRGSTSRAGWHRWTGQARHLLIGACPAPRP